MKIQAVASLGRAARLLLAGSVASLAGLACAHAATTEINVWYAMNAHNGKAFEKLVKQFNRGQDAVNVELKPFDSADDLASALDASLEKKEKGARPNLVQLEDPRSPDGMDRQRDILPLYVLLAKYPIKGAQWFLSPFNTFAHDTRGRLTGFPYMASVPVLFYNTDAFRKSGVKPLVPLPTWLGLQAQLLTLADNDSRGCPLSMGEPVSLDLENLAAVNKQYYASSDNGFKAKGLPKFNFDLMYVRHLSLMKSWASSGILVRPTSDATAVARFAKRECAALMSESDNIGAFNDIRRLDFGVTGLPHYPEITGSPGNAFVGGSALWAISGHPAAQDKAVAVFLAWLAKPENAAKWYQQTGYLPLTRQAFDATDAGYYKHLGNWRDIVASYASRPDPTGRGFWVNNYPKIRAMLRQTLDDALNGKEPAVPALRSAASQADQMMRERRPAFAR